VGEKGVQMWPGRPAEWGHALPQHKAAPNLAAAGAVPRAGCDLNRRNKWGQFGEFQSPARGATETQTAEGWLVDISTHAPARGTTCAPTARPYRPAISIHSLRGERDATSYAWTPTAADFNPLAPRGSETVGRITCCLYRQNFNPLALCESETILALYFLLSYVNFNPRFPWGKRGEQPE